MRCNIPSTVHGGCGAPKACGAWCARPSSSVDQFVYPIFVRSGQERPIPSMPGQAQVPVDGAVKLAERCAKAGIPAVILFGVPDNERKGRGGLLRLE